MGGTPARDRLHRLVDLARLYRGWTRRQLAQALGRDPTRVYPDTDTPKADYMLALADALEWSLDEVFEYVYSGIEPDRSAAANVPADAPFEQLDRLAKDACLEGDFPRMLSLARRAQHAARTAEQRALAFVREFGAWQGMGRYPRAMAALRRAQAEATSIPNWLRVVIQANFALAHLMISELHAARGYADAILEWYREQKPQGAVDENTIAMAQAVRGHVFRALISEDPACSRTHAKRAAADLRKAGSAFGRLHEQLDNPWLDYYRRWCEWGLADAQCHLGRRDVRDVAEKLLRDLDALREKEKRLSRPELLAWGVGCVIIAGALLRECDSREVEHCLAVLLGKALDVAEAIPDWGLRAEAMTLRYRQYARAQQRSGLKLDFVLDEEELRAVVGLVGRFPNYRRLGWEMLDQAVLVRRTE